MILIMASIHGEAPNPHPPGMASPRASSRIASREWPLHAVPVFVFGGVDRPRPSYREEVKFTLRHDKSLDGWWDGGWDGERNAAWALDFGWCGSPNHVVVWGGATKNGITGSRDCDPSHDFIWKGGINRSQMIGLFLGFWHQGKNVKIMGFTGHVDW